MARITNKITRRFTTQKKLTPDKIDSLRDKGGLSLGTNMKNIVGDMLENLIEQFSDIFCFYRELIQNSLDAGTNRIDISLEYLPPENKKSQGIMIIHVDDYGEGMNRQIIDNELTRLFSSSKENDLTKIGKFGIGFVSVFAIKPDAVNIDTSRDGEDWRILFNNNKEFERLRRDYPVDGTKIQIIKSCDKKFYDNFRTRSLETIKFWCKHSEAEIYFENERVNEPFEIESPLSIHAENASGEIVAAYTSLDTPFFGFYNKGLTLIEGNRLFFPHIAFKIKSKYLEHTLARDNIRQDENYWKAIEFLNEVVKSTLPDKLFAAIEEEITGNEKETQKYQDILEFALNYFIQTSYLPEKSLERKFLRDTEGGFITVGDFLKMRSQLYFLVDSGTNSITENLNKQKKRVIKTTRGSRFIVKLKWLSKKLWGQIRVRWASDYYYMPILTDKKALTPIHKKLIAAVDDINRKMGHKTEPLKFAHFDYPQSAIKKRVFIMQKDPGAMSPTKELAIKERNYASIFSLFASTRTLILNLDHSYIQEILKLSQIDMEFSAYLLSKLLYLDDGIDTETDCRLAAISLNRREKQNA